MAINRLREVYTFLEYSPIRAMGTLFSKTFK